MRKLFLIFLLIPIVSYSDAPMRGDSLTIGNRTVTNITTATSVTSDTNTLVTARTLYGVQETINTTINTMTTGTIYSIDSVTSGSITLTAGTRYPTL